MCCMPWSTDVINVMDGMDDMHAIPFMDVVIVIVVMDIIGIKR